MTAIPDNLIYGLISTSKVQHFEQLITSGALDVNHIFRSTTDHTVHGSTLLNCAIFFQNYALVRILLHNNCNVNLAAYVNSISERQNQIEIKQPPARDYLHRTPLYQALCRKNSRLVKCLVDCGADVNLYDGLGSTALWHAVDNNDFDIVNTVLKAPNCDIAAKDNLGMTALHVAAVHGNMKILSALMKQGAVVDCQHVQGSTPLFIPCSGGHVLIVKFFLQHGADPNLVDNDGFGVLQVTLSQSCNDEVVDLLLYSGIAVINSVISSFGEPFTKLLGESEHVKNAIAFYVDKPRELKVLSSLRIKQLLRLKRNGRSILDDLGQLPLPLPLLDYLQLNRC